MTPRERAIEAVIAARRNNPANAMLRGPEYDAYWSGQADRVAEMLAVAVPVLLNDLADRIEADARRWSALRDWSDGKRDAAVFVRAAAEGFGECRDAS